MVERDHVRAGAQTAPEGLNVSDEAALRFRLRIGAAFDGTAQFGKVALMRVLRVLHIRARPIAGAGCGSS